MRIRATTEQIRTIRAQLRPEAMRNGDNGTYHVMDKSSDNRKVKSAGATNYRDTLKEYPKLLRYLDELYDALEEQSQSPCHQARQDYWLYRQRVREAENR